ncbi:MAG: hypothetical protein FWE45_04690 [Firmicutes bacterium]|nr:hypothetical protein [Bacillota bacterium]
MKRLKRCLTLVMVTLFVAAFAMGCALFAPDVEYSRNLVVARVGNSIEIRRHHLETAFQAWGQQFIQQGDSPERALDRTLDILIEREIMVHLAGTDQFFGSHGEGALGTLTVAEANRALRNTYEAMERNINQIMQQIRDELNMGGPNTPEQEVPGGIVFTPFEHYITTEVVNNTRIFNLNVDRFKEFDPIVMEPNETMDEFIERAFAPRGTTQAEIDLARETKNRFVRFLRTREEGREFTASQNTPEAVIKREIERIQIEEEKSMLLQRFRDTFSQGTMHAGPEYFQLFVDRHRTEKVEVDGEYILPMDLWLDRVSSRSQSYVNSIVNGARTHYQHNVRMAINRFERGLDTTHSISQSIIGGIENVRWAPASIINDFFTVSHILVGFTDEERAELERQEARMRNREISQADFIAIRDGMRANLTTRDRDEDGHQIGPELSVNQVLGIVQREVTGSHNKQLTFRNLLYRFGSDPGMQNPQFEYTMGLDTRPTDHNGDRIGEDHNSRMVEPFTIAARSLRENGQVGDISGVVWSDFGAHIIMYTRDVSDFVFSNSETRLSQTYQNFLFQTQTSYGNKTFFDAIVEQLTRSEYQDAENGVLATFKGQHTITINPRNFRNML